MKAAGSIIIRKTSKNLFGAIFSWHAHLLGPKKYLRAKMPRGSPPRKWSLEPIDDIKSGLPFTADGCAEP